MERGQGKSAHLYSIHPMLWLNRGPSSPNAASLTIRLPPFPVATLSMFYSLQCKKKKKLLSIFVYVPARPRKYPGNISRLHIFRRCTSLTGWNLFLVSLSLFFTIFFSHFLPAHSFFFQYFLTFFYVPFFLLLLLLLLLLLSDIPWHLCCSTVTVWTNRRALNLSSGPGSASNRRQ